MSVEMRVVKRNGEIQDVEFDKILRRMKKLGADAEPPILLNFSGLAMKVIDQLYDRISTSAIDELTAEQCAAMCTHHPSYGRLAAAVVASNNHKNTSPSLLDITERLFQFKDKHGRSAPLVAAGYMETIRKNSEVLQARLNFKRDHLIDYFGFKTLERAYLMRIDGKIVERPQHLWMRVAVGIHGDDISSVLDTYELMSQKYFTHATPTLYNAGTPRPQLSSCYLLALRDDSIDGIYDTLKQCAQISKWAGGIGLHIHNLRATGSHIRGTNGTSNGIVPMLQVFNKTARYVDQGGGKRNGSFAMYIEPWHADIRDFLDLRKNHGDEEMRARDLFYALWVPDLFMERVKSGDDWTLMCPDECPGLSEVCGEEFVELYERYESEGKGRETVPARDIWYRILDAQMETGTPYMLYKDAVNAKCNQRNLGTIKSSNLCTEITEFSSPGETAVCNLASVALSRFVNEDGIFDYSKLGDVVRRVTRNLDKVIDVNYYPTPETRKSNLRHRPIGIGVQGLADAFALMRLAYHSPEARVINRRIFETIYFASLSASCAIAEEREAPMRRIREAIQCGGILFKDDADPVCRDYTTRGHDLDRDLANMLPIPAERDDKYPGAYSSFSGSPASQGLLQFDLWKEKPDPALGFDWDGLKARIQKSGLRNSLLVAPMPTASTAHILGNNECFEPFTSNIYSRRTIAGDFVVPNKHLMRELADAGLWTLELKDNIIANKGSIQHIEGLPEGVKERYKTVWEIPMKHMIDMAADRGAFICQSQSLNVWVEDPDYRRLNQIHFYGWEKGLKTGMYYLRRKPKHQPQQFTIEPEAAPSCEMCSG